MMNFTESDFIDGHFTEMLPYPVYLKNLTGEVIYSNRKFVEFFHVPEDISLVGKRITDIYSGTDFSLHEYYDKELLDSDKDEIEYTASFDIEGKGFRDIRINKSKIYKNKKLYAFLCVFSDVTEIMSLEKKLANSLKEVSKLSEKRKNFASFLSHELKNSLGSIAIISDNALMTENDLIRTDNLISIRQIVEYMNTLVSEVLILSREEEGCVYIKYEDSSIESILSFIRDMFSYQIKNMGLNFEIHNELSFKYFKSDPSKVKQVLINLIGNSLKYTEKGSIVLRISENKTENKIIFSVADTGMGIPEDKTDKIFEPFYTIVNNRKRSFGTGIGLAVCANTAKVLGGSITCKSSYGLGSEFIFEIPYMPSSKVSEEIKKVYSRKVLTVLVIDDSPINIYIEKMILEKLGHRVFSAESGEEGLSVLDEENIDCIITDISMPDMSGIEFAEKIRSGKHKDKCLIGLSGYDRDEYYHHVESGLFNDILTKPMKIETINEIIHNAHSKIFS
ncbi:MAG: response regulator [Spirochaetes bacterium]|nr:response regulator [Spirochaetota bacterium]